MTLAEICQEILQIYREYVGSGMVGALFAASVFYLIFGEKAPAKKLVLGIVPLVVAALFACPLFAWVIYLCLDSEIYYRFLWLLPVTLVIAYAGTRLVLRVQGMKRLLAMLMVCGAIMICGDYVYDNSYFKMAENPYHVPDTVAEICDEIRVEGREVRAVFPTELIQYVRQYTPYVCMPYGREMLVDRWNLVSEVYEVYELGMPDGIVYAEDLAEVCRKYSVHYIIWDEKRTMEGELSEWGFALKTQIGGYTIYVDEEAYLGL